MIAGTVAHAQRMLHTAEIPSSGSKRPKSCVGRIGQDAVRLTLSRELPGPAAWAAPLVHCAPFSGKRYKCGVDGVIGVLLTHYFTCDLQYLLKEPRPAETD